MYGCYTTINKVPQGDGAWVFLTIQSLSFLGNIY